MVRISNTGIDILGYIPWGTHICQFYQAKEDLVDILVPYFKAGLENNEFCIWVTSEDFSAEQAKISMKEVIPNLDRYLRKGQMEVVSQTEWYFKDGAFEPERTLTAWINKLNQVLTKGYSGIRVTSSLASIGNNWSNISGFEERINDIIGRYRMTMVCTYSLVKCGAYEVIDVVRNHEFALIKRGNEWELIESSGVRPVEEVVAKSRDFYLKFFDEYSFPVWRAGIDGKPDYVNKSWLSFTGSMAGQEIGDDCTEWIHPEDRHQYTKTYLEAFKARKPYETEYRLRRYDGEYRWMMEFGRPISDLYGQFAGYIGTCCDITERNARNGDGDAMVSVEVGPDVAERKQVEDALHQLEERFRIAAESASDLIYEWDLSSGRLEWFGNIDERLGYASGEFPRTLDAWEKIIHPADYNRVMAAMERHLKTQEPFFEEYRVKRKDGTFLHWKVRGTAIRDAQGNPSKWIGVNTDISELKFVEEALKKERDFISAIFHTAGPLVVVRPSVGEKPASAIPASKKLVTGWKR